ncbi:hypothetical protein [Porphyrobacter sp. YT40]|uniref:hypothetical protein n=1 Tax=Porphyrobacter sp. YT40 TaxID=2547601 RepID=UPI001142C377|nr:hypothetical protein [Porphyrobacter sp. YT40]QDH33976.1 hypothetical protein E2E27_06290 [Porphyrobacter sp. YT40]
MSVFFAMVGEGGDRRPAFFLTRNSAPESAVEISDARHGELLQAQSEGRAITADARGRPVVARRTRPDKPTLRAQLAVAIRREAAARIRTISPEWRQMNDLREPSEEGAVRFARIDAIRAASGAIEELADSLPAADLAAFPVATHTLWPEFD